MNATPLHVLSGPTGSGKTTYVEHVRQPGAQLPFIIATQR